MLTTAGPSGGGKYGLNKETETGNGELYTTAKNHKLLLLNVKIKRI